MCRYCENIRARESKIVLAHTDVNCGVLGVSRSEVYIKFNEESDYPTLTLDTLIYKPQEPTTVEDDVSLNDGLFVKYCPFCGEEF